RRPDRSRRERAAAARPNRRRRAPTGASPNVKGVMQVSPRNYLRSARPPSPRPNPNLLLKKSFQFVHGVLTGDTFTAPSRLFYGGNRPMARKLILLAL